MSEAEELFEIGKSVAYDAFLISRYAKHLEDEGLPVTHIDVVPIDEVRTIVSAYANLSEEKLSVLRKSYNLKTLP